jgi:integrase
VYEDTDAGLLEMIFGQRRIWWDRQEREEIAASDPDTSIRHHAERFIDFRKSKIGVGDLSAKGWDNERHALKYFRDFACDESAIESIDPASIQGFYVHLSKLVSEGKLSKDYAAKVFRAMRNFVGHLAGSGAIPRPVNLDSRSFRFNVSAKAVKTISREDLQKLIDGAAGQTRLHVLLMLNCGMTQQDISDLQHDEVDWKSGRIIRKRSKTGDHESVPTVDYKLWEPTFRLLREHRSKHLSLVLTTRKGTPWVYSIEREGKLRSKDSIGLLFRRLATGLKLRVTPKQLRKTAASLLASHESHGRHAQHFLGHAPRSIADKHYLAPPQALFDKAVDWLGNELGLSKE